MIGGFGVQRWTLIVLIAVSRVNGGTSKFAPKITGKKKCRGRISCTSIEPYGPYIIIVTKYR